MTNSPKSEAREFILVKEKLSNAALAFDLGSFIPQNWPPSSYVDTLYVIEKSAYDSLKQQALAMREALALYADPKNHEDHGLGSITEADAIIALEKFDEFMRRGEK